MYDRGEDLYGDIVRRGHDLGMDVYVAIRMNDNHFWSDSARKAFPLAPEDMAKTVRPELTQFRKDHPEWVLGIGNAPRWGRNVVEHGDPRGAGVRAAPHQGGLHAWPTGTESRSTGSATPSICLRATRTACGMR